VAPAGLPRGGPEQIFNEKDASEEANCREFVPMESQNPQILREADFPPKAWRLLFLGFVP
jgi:hypothetical protein